MEALIDDKWISYIQLIKMNIDRRNPSAFFEIDSVLRQLRNNAQISLKDMAFLIHKA